MKKINWQNFSVQTKISSIYVAANLMILIVNLFLLMGINRMSEDMEQVYRKNLRLNELSAALNQVQDSMTAYLTSMTSAALGDYYWNNQNYQKMIEELNAEITGSTFDRMERNIRNLSEEYLEAADQTIDAKRGRNVEKYRLRYENATRLYNYIDTYIYSLNNEQFKRNSESYVELFRVFRTFEAVSVLIIILVIAINILVIVKLAANITKPLKNLAGLANEVAEGNFELELVEPASRDEIGIVTGAFNQMVISIREYIRRIKISMETERDLKEKELLMEAHLKDAQLKYLQAQINPHFLFNTLNAGAQLAMLEESDKTYEYLQNVAEFFRYTVKKGNDKVTIREEIELADHYIYILNVRFSGEIRYEKRIEPSLLGVSMPSMILQPLVENSVNHGIREMAGEGNILLSVYREGNMACISIRDNGIGMDEETIDRVMNGTYREEDLPADSNGIGMDNVIARMRLFTGNKDVIRINSKWKDQGTEVILYLPLQEPEE